MKLIRTITRSVRKKTLSKNPYHTETSQLTKTNQLTGRHMTRASSERHFSTDIIIRLKILLSKWTHHTEDRQLAHNVKQLSGLHTTWAPSKGPYDLVIIVSKYSRPKNELVLADIYAIKFLYKQKLINVKTHNVKQFLRY